MTLGPKRTAGPFWLAALALEVAAFSLACRLADASAAGAEADRALAVAILGESRLAIGAALFEAADDCFHRGVGHYRPRGFSDVFVRLGREIAPQGHVHLAGGETAEILPWLFLATRADPRNVTAYAVAAFWLAGEANRPDLAERVLAEARRQNPRAHGVYLESGRLALKRGDQERAGRYLQAALALGVAGAASEDRQQRLDMAETLVYLGLLAEAAGDLGRAGDLYRRALEYAPARPALRQRLEFLETHGRSPAPPLEVWQAMLSRHGQVCQREHAEGGGTEH